MGWLQLSNNQTPAATSGSSPTVVFTGVSGVFEQVTAVNTGVADGFISFDFEQAIPTWAIMPAATASDLRRLALKNATIAIQRLGSSDMSGVYIFGHYTISNRL